MESQIHGNSIFMEILFYGNRFRQAIRAVCIYCYNEKINSDGANRLKTYENCIVFMEMLVFFSSILNICIF